MRAPYQVLVIPFYSDGSQVLFACLTRSDQGYIQFVAGGGEQGEQPIEAAARELAEETGLMSAGRIKTLTSMAVLQVDYVCGRLWGDDVILIPEFAFAARIDSPAQTRLSSEHSRCDWLPYQEARAALRWESNRKALLELHEALESGVF